jgi:hypothetical protein
MDYGICEDKHKNMTDYKWHKPDIEEKKWGWHSLVCGETYYKWFYCIPAARELNAPASLSLFQEYVRTKTDEETYMEAMSLCESIPKSYSGIF